jgi:hypothetical protein
MTVRLTKKECKQITDTIQMMLGVNELNNDDGSNSGLQFVSHPYDGLDYNFNMTATVTDPKRTVVEIELIQH